MVKVTFSIIFFALIIGVWMGDDYNQMEPDKKILELCMDQVTEEEVTNFAMLWPGGNEMLEKREELAALLCIPKLLDVVFNSKMDEIYASLPEYMVFDIQINALLLMCKENDSAESDQCWPLLFVALTLDRPASTEEAMSNIDLEQ